MTEMDVHKLTIGIIGGTGKEGKGLAYRWAKTGHRIIIGSRQEEKALKAAEDVNNLLGSKLVEGSLNEAAASQADLVVLTVPYTAHIDMCHLIKPYIQGKVIIDVTVPIVPPKITLVQLPPEGSAAQQAQAIFGDDVQVVSAFQNIAYEHLLNNEPIACDVLVTGGKKETRMLVIDLIKEIGLTAWNAGPIANSVVAEGLTSILIGLNKQFGVESSGIQITGINRKSQNY